VGGGNKKLFLYRDDYETNLTEEKMVAKPPGPPTTRFEWDDAKKMWKVTNGARTKSVYWIEPSTRRPAPTEKKATTGTAPPLSF
jgi:hypothetical protein